MARKEIEKVEEEIEKVEEESKVLTPREIAFNKLVANYAIANPVKYAAKKARGEFDKIPDTFKGIVKIIKGKEHIS